MRRIEYYRTRSGRSPVEEFLQALTDKQSAKLEWVMRIVREMEDVPAQYLKKLPGTDGLWDCGLSRAGMPSACWDSSTGRWWWCW
jgi:hypothetical protein